MVKLVFIFAIPVLISCSHMTNDEIIAESKKCEAAGMLADQTYNAYTYNVVEVICRPKRNQNGK